MRAAKRRFKKDRDRRTINRNFDDTSKNKVVAVQISNVFFFNFSKQKINFLK